LNFAVGSPVSACSNFERAYQFGLEVAQWLDLTDDDAAALLSL
jgi:hypothetical protein